MKEIFFIVLFLCAIAFPFWQISEIYKFETQGILTSAEIKSAEETSNGGYRGRRRSKKYMLKIEFLDQHGEKRKLTRFLSKRRRDIPEGTHPYPVGSFIDLYYLPDNPESIRFVERMDSAYWIRILIILIPVFSIYLWLTLPHIRQSDF